MKLRNSTIHTFLHRFFFEEIILSDKIKNHTKDSKNSIKTQFFSLHLGQFSGECFGKLILIDYFNFYSEFSYRNSQNSSKEKENER